MTVSQASIDRLESHWALAAIGSTGLQHATELANERLVERAVGKQISFAFPPNEANDSLLHRVALAYELAAIEGLGQLTRTVGLNPQLREQAVAAAHRAFEFRRLQLVPEDVHARVFHVLQLSALAYCGDRWSDLRRWFNENSRATESPSVASVEWDSRVLFRLFHCWVRLFRKHGWDDLDQVREVIAGLRQDQLVHESGVLDNGSDTKDRFLAFRLLALYHWAKATEILAEYMLQGSVPSVQSQIDKHFEAAVSASSECADSQLETLLLWLHAASRTMVQGSIWWVTRAVNSRTTAFVKAITKREQQPLFELLPPQRTALAEKGLLDTAKTAVVVDMPTSGGKTLLAQFRILQALNQFDADKGWVAYVAPTRALSAQITRRLRRDFEPIGIRVEQLSGAVDVDTFENDLLSDPECPFHILIATPEKLSLVIRNKKVSRPLALVVMDEAHNIDNASRGLRIELLLATVKRDCPTANFLLLMPYVESGESIARWLSQDQATGNSISFSTTAWRPNERIVGTFFAEPDSSRRSDWHLSFEALTVTPKALALRGTHTVGSTRPINVPKSDVLDKEADQKGLALQTAAMAVVLSTRGPSIAVGNTIPSVWQMARKATEKLPLREDLSEDVKLVQDFLRTEVSPDFELVEMLNHGVGVHHAGLSDEIRALMEWLTETGEVSVLCATSTVAQGINFPVSSVFLSTRYVYQDGQSEEIHPRDFWNLAGRAGRLGQDSVGVVGIAAGKDPSGVKEFVSQATGSLASRLVTLLRELDEQGRLAELSSVIFGPKWEDFRCYVAHLWAEKGELDSVLAESEQILRQTYGYGMLRASPESTGRADALLEATREYARGLAARPGLAKLADATGFSPEGVGRALGGLGGLERTLTPDDWRPESLFGDSQHMADLFGVMLQVPQLADALNEIGGKGADQFRLSSLTKDWVNGMSLQDIARIHFLQDSDDETKAFTEACRAIYRSLVNCGTWGLAGLSNLSGINFDELPESERRFINSIPAMVYHGVRTEEAVLMRINGAPRSAAEKLGALYKETESSEARATVASARRFLRELSIPDWDRVRPSESALTGAGYRRVWELLSGDAG